MVEIEGVQMPLFHVNEGSIKEFDEHEISEEKLRTLFENHGLIFIEKGIKFIDRNLSAGNGFIDTFAIDENKKPIIIEYKVNEGVSGEALAQTLSYASFVTDYSERFAKIIKQKLNDPSIKEEDIDFDNLRIVLVAPEFSYHVINAVKQIEPGIKLIKYKLFKAGGTESLSTEVVFDSFSRRSPVLAASYKIEDHFQRGYANMRLTFDKLCAEVKRICNVEPYAKKYFIAFKKNYMFIDVHVYTEKIELGLTLPENQDPPTLPFQISREGQFGSRVTHFIRISKPEDVNEELLKWIKIYSANS